MRDNSNPYQVPTVPVIGKSMLRGSQTSQKVSSLSQKRLGDYLIEAGLLTKSQVDVALNDQKMTEMKFGEIVSARSWVKQQTVEYLMAKVVLPERKRAIEHARKAREAAPAAASEPSTAGRSSTSRAADSQANSSQAANSQAFARREIPISKPLPSVKSTDGDVNWVG